MEDHTARGSGLAHIHYIVILHRKEVTLCVKCGRSKKVKGETVTV